MGLSEFLSSFIPTVYAEEEEVVEVVEVEEQPAEEVEEEEEEEEEPEDPKEAIMEGKNLPSYSRAPCTNVVFIECAKQCPSLKHHLDECNERVENGSSENCM